MALWEEGVRSCYQLLIILSRGPIESKTNTRSRPIRVLILILGEGIMEPLGRPGLSVALSKRKLTFRKAFLGVLCVLVRERVDDVPLFGL